MICRLERTFSVTVITTSGPVFKKRLPKNSVVDLRESLIMARPKAKAPSLRYHLSGQSVVTIDGRDYYLGKHDSPESLARYAVLIAAYQAGGLTLPDDFDARTWMRTQQRF